jgi:hypothetical protein
MPTFAKKLSEASRTGSTATTEVKNAFISLQLKCLEIGTVKERSSEKSLELVFQNKQSIGVFEIMLPGKVITQLRRPPMAILRPSFVV